VLTLWFMAPFWKGPDYYAHCQNLTKQNCRKSIAFNNINENSEKR